MKCKASSQIHFTPIPAKYPINSTPAEVTKHSMDSSYQLNQYLEVFQRYANVNCMIQPRALVYLGVL